MAGIGQKVKDVAHKMGIGHTHREEEMGRHTGTGTEYENEGGTYGTAATSGVVPGTTTTAGTGPLEGGAYGTERAPGTGGAYGTEGGAYGTEGAYGERAYGTEGAYGAEGRERREGYETRTVDVPVVQQTTTAAMPGAYVEGGARGPEVCGAEHFTKVEDRPVVKERVQQVVEHRPVEKEFVVETRQTGAEREVGTGEVEHLGTQERVVGVAPPRAPCE